MKKFYTLTAAACLAVAANAAIVKVTPATGSTMETLSSIQIESTLAAYPDVWMPKNLTSASIEILKDGEPVEGYAFSTSGYDPRVVTFNPAIEEAGQYQITISKMAYTCDNDDGDSVDPTDDIVLKYNITGSTQPQEPSMLEWTPNPAPGVVESLSAVTFTYDTSVYDEIEVASIEDIYVTRNGEKFSALTRSYGSNTVTFTLKTPATEEGTYNLVIDPYSVTAYQDDYQSSFDNPEQMVYEYIIEASAPVTPEYTIKWTPDPAPGTVEGLTSVVFTYDTSVYDEIEVASSEDIYVTRNGEKFSAIKATITGNKATFNLKTPAIDGGTYQLIFEPGSLTAYTDDYNDTFDNPEQMVYEYIIEASAPVTPEYTIKWTPDPAPGTVEGLTSVVFTYDTSVYDEIEVASSEDIYVTRNGEKFSAIKANITGNKATFNLKTPAIDGGTYQLIFEPGSLTAYTDDYNDTFDNPEKMVYEYVIEGEGPVEEFYYETSLISGTTYEAPITELSFTWFNCEKAMITDSLAEDVQVLKDGDVFTTGKSVTNSENTSTLTFAEEITEAGVYQINFPNQFCYYFPTGSDFSNFEFVSLDPITITVKAPAQPVVYDLLPASTKPADNAIINLREDTFDTIFVNVANGLRPAQDAKVSIVNDTETYSNEVELKFSYETRLWAQFKEPNTNGIYTITIPQGSFGDADWQADNTKGHANAEVKVVVYVTGDATSVKTDLAPTAITPEAGEVTDLSEITLTFPEGTVVLDEARGKLFGGSNGYNEYADIEAGTEAGTFTMKFNRVPSELADYTLNIPAYCFGDAEYEETHGVKGHVNGTLNITWSLVSGIESIEAGDAKVIYFDMQGRRIQAPTAGQPVIRLEAGKASKRIK